MSPDRSDPAQPRDANEPPEHDRRFWDESFDRLADYLLDLQRREQEHGRKQ